MCQDRIKLRISCNGHTFSQATLPIANIEIFQRLMVMMVIFFLQEKDYCLELYSYYIIKEGI